MTDEPNGKLTLAKAILKADPAKVIMLATLGAMLYVGYVLLNRFVRHLDRVEIVLDRHAEAADATRRAIERLTDDTRHGREGAVDKIMNKVERCCSPGKR